MDITFETKLPFGTQKPCKVHDVIAHGVYAGLVIFADGEPNPYLLLHQKDAVEGIAKGDRGTLTLTRGGPHKAYWAFEKVS